MVLAALLMGAKSHSYTLLDFFTLFFIHPADDPMIVLY